MIIDRPNFMPQTLPGELPAGMDVANLGLTEDVPAGSAFDAIYAAAYEAAQRGVPAYSITKAGRTVYSPVDGREYGVMEIVHAAMTDARATLVRASDAEFAMGGELVNVEKHYTPYLVTDEKGLNDGLSNLRPYGRPFFSRVGALAGNALRTVAPNNQQIKRWGTVVSLGAALYGIAAETDVVHDIRSSICAVDTSKDALGWVIGPVQHKLCGAVDRPGESDNTKIYNEYDTRNYEPWQKRQPGKGEIIPDDLDDLAHPAREPGSVPAKN